MRLFSSAVVCLIAVTASVAQPIAANTANPGEETRPARIGKVDLASVTDQAIAAFREAWVYSKMGRGNEEGTVLLFYSPDGSIIARLQSLSNQFRQSSFRWQPGAIAIVHTHPTRTDPQPSPEDKRLADRLGVPIFTLTVRGMFVYDPGTKQISKLFDWVDWLDPAKWERFRHTKQARRGEP